MAVIVEDGTGKSDAQCYCDHTYVLNYLAERGITHSYTQSAIEGALVISAKDWIDGQHTFRYEILVEDQALSFPRAVFGFPSNIPLANCKAAILQLKGALLVDTSKISTSGTVTSESKQLGPLSKSVTYKDGTDQTYYRVLPVDLTRLLKPYLLKSTGNRVIR